MRVAPEDEPRVVPHAVLGREHPREHRGVRRKRHRRRRPRLLEEPGVRREAVEVRGAHLRVAVGREAVGAERVDRDQDDGRPGSDGSRTVGSSGLRASTPEGGSEEREGREGGGHEGATAHQRAPPRIRERALLPGEARVEGERAPPLGEERRASSIRPKLLRLTNPVRYASAVGRVRTIASTRFEASARSPREAATIARPESASRLRG